MYHGLQKALNHVLLSCEAPFQLHWRVFVYPATFSNLIFVVAPRAAPPPPFFSPRSSPAETVEQFIQCHTFVAPIRIHQVFGRARSSYLGIIPLPS